MKSFIRLLASFLIAMVLATALAPAATQAQEAPQQAQQEKILSFDSDIVVNSDRSMIVTETIQVFANRDKINHGIYRDFPTTYKDRFGNRVRVDFEILSILRNGFSEPYHTAAMSNGIRIYIGSQHTVLPPAEYTYTIRYRTDRQLGFFEDHDELYWNVTGNGWEFSMEKVTCTVHLPDDIPRDGLSVEAYTGFKGQQRQAYTSEVRDDGTVRYQTTQSLDSFQGLTIVVGWPKGFITPPTQGDRIHYFMSDNTGTLLGGAGLLAMFLYLFVAWLIVGKDPPKGAIMPMYTPPDDLSPAAMRYIERMGFDNKCVTAALVNAAVKGWVIIQNDHKKYSLTKNVRGNAPLSRDESKLCGALFLTRKHIELKQENHLRISIAVDTTRTTLAEMFRKKDFSTNSIYLAPGVILAILGAVGLFTRAGSILWFIAYIPSVIFLLVLFYHLMKKPTTQGRRLMDRIEGFRMFLSVTEKERLNLLNPPQRTPELFERYLPYALALGVENQWTDQFTSVFAAATAAASTDPTQSTHAYHLYWYAGHFSNWNHFTNSLSSTLSSTISSSSQAPGSSSGGGGGGFSGGGGGGGGGGGW